MTMRDQIKALDAELEAVQRDYIKRSVGLPANALALLEKPVLEKVRELRAKRSQLVRAERKKDGNS